MKTINYNITLLIILLIFASCKTEDSGSDAGTDAQDTVDVSGQEDIEEDISVTDDIINCIDNDGDQYGEGDDCLGTDCDDNDPDNWISCSACIDSDSDNYFANCDSYTTIQGPDCDDNVLECNSDCSDTNNNNHRDCDEECVDNDRDGYGEGTDCLGPDCDDNTGTCITDCSDNDGDGIEDCNFCIEHPHQLSEYAPLIGTLFLQDNYIYSLLSNGITIIDISDPESPQQISSYYFDNSENINLTSIYVLGNYVYLAGSKLCNDITCYGLIILDISDLTAPYEVSFYDTNSNTSEMYAKDDVYVQGNYAYLTVNNDNEGIYGMKIIDVSEPLNPKEVAFWETPEIANDVWVRDNYAYLIDKYTFYIIDITDPLVPDMVGSVSTMGIININLYVNDNYAFINGGMIIINISDVINPVIAGRISEEYIGSSGGDVYVYKNYLFVSSGNYYIDENLITFSILDISDIESPQLILYSDSNESEETYFMCPFGFVIKDRYLYFSCVVYSLLCEP